MSLDGYIADNQLTTDFIEGVAGEQLEDIASPQKCYDFDAFNQAIDCIVMGKTSFQQGYHLAYADKTIYVVTQEKRRNEGNLHYVLPKQIIKLMLAKQKQGKTIYILGGAKTAQLFINAGVIDEYVIGTVPYLLGDGRRLFAESSKVIPLKLTAVDVLGGMTLCVYQPR